MSLQEIGDRCNTDKAYRHSYLPIYEELLGPCRLEPLTLLEIGISRGSSLAMWLEWMPNAMILGADINLPNVGHERLRMFCGDQTDENFLYKFRGLTLDVIVDDGSHRSRDQLLTCHGLWKSLKPGGWYFIEDVEGADRLPYWEMMPGYRSWVLGKCEDDILVALRKPE